MLSRVAENIYWLARYVERAENTARLLRVNTQLMLDTPKGVTPGWDPLITIIGHDADFHSCCDEASERNVVKFLIGETKNPGSILSLLAIARENCRTVREILPRSAWELLNELHIYAKEHMQQGISKKGRNEFLSRIIAGSQQLNGMFGSALYRDEAYHFARIGRNLERADMTTRIIDVRSTDLFEEEEIESRSLDALQWISVLKSLSAYQSYRRHQQIRVSRSAVMHFLFKDTRFPRSVVHCVETVESSVAKFKHHADAQRSLHALNEAVLAIDTDRISQGDLHQAIDDLQLGIMQVHEVLSSTYFQTDHQAA
jgi:uncharacterized alpha-E superfamily protein